MKVLVNGESKEITDRLNLREFLRHLDLPQDRVAIELNKTVVRKKDWDSTRISDEDTIEIIHFVGGG